MCHKPRRRRGETLTETLAAVLMVSLSSVVLLTFSLHAGQINREAAGLDDSFREAVARAEAQDPWSPGEEKELQVGGYTYTVILYGQEGMYSYTLKEVTPP